MIEQLNKLIAMLRELQKKLNALYRKSIYMEALKHIGTDASPADRVDDVLGCAESVTEIINKVIPFPIITGTWTLWDRLRRDSRFRKTGIPMPGDIVISATGNGNGRIRGHVGVVGYNSVIMSNDSATGKFMANYTLDGWDERYRQQGGIPTEFYTRVR